MITSARHAHIVIPYLYFFRGEHDYGNDSRTLYEPLLGERQALYSKENGARVLTLDRDKSAARMET